MSLKTPRSKSTIIVLALLLALLPATVGAYDWSVFGFDQQHSGNNTSETIVNKSNVLSLQKLFQVSLPAGVDGAPLYLSNVSGTISGTIDMVFVAVSNGDIEGLNAKDGAQIWIKHNPAGSCKINNGSTTCYTTSSPVLDPNHQYVYSYGLDGKVHKYQVKDGLEITTGGWPELATTKPFDEKGSSALSVGTARNGISYLYVANGGYPGDNGDYQGHLTTINLNDGSQHIFNANCSNQVDVHFVERPATPDCSQTQTAIWARVGAVYDADIDKIFVSTGNGNYSPTNFNWGDSVLSLNPDGTGSGGGNPVDSFTPANYQTLQNEDADIGSTAPVVLPTSGYPGIKYPHLALQAGKQYSINNVNHTPIHLLNLDNLSNLSTKGPGQVTPITAEVAPPIDVAQGNEVLTAPAVWVNGNTTWAFIVNDQGSSAYTLTTDGNGFPSLQPVWHLGSSFGGSSPIVVNGVLYFAQSNNIHALDPLTGNSLWSSNIIGGIHWSSPILANGVLYIADGGHSSTGKLTAFSPNGVLPTPGPTPTPTPTPPVGNSHTYAVPFAANAANGFTTFLSLQNMGASPASVSIQYYSANGTALSTDSNTSLNSYTLWNPSQKLTLGQSGAAIVSSNQPLNIVVAEATPFGGSAYVLPAAIGNSLISPLALNGTYGFTTQLTIFNSGSSASQVTVQYYDNTGNLQQNVTKNITLPAHSLSTINEATIGLPAQFNGWALLSGDSNFLSAQVLEQNPTTHFVAIANATTPAAQLFAPAIFNNAFGGYVTGANIVNPNNSPAAVTVTYYDLNGSPKVSPTFNIPAHGVQPIYHGAASGNGLPTGGLPLSFAGSAKINSTQGVVLVVNEDGGISSSGSRRSGVYTGNAGSGNTLGLPVMSNGFIGYYTGSTILNTTDSLINISVQYYDTTGNAVGSAHIYNLAAHASHFAYQGNENPALPANFYGSAVISAPSGSSIVAVTNASNSQYFYSYTEQQGT